MNDAGRTRMNEWRPDDLHARLFVDATASTLSAYRSATLFFVSVAHESDQVLLQGVLQLSVSPPEHLLPPLQVGVVCAAQVQLPFDGSQVLDFLRVVTSGANWSANQYTLRFLPEDSARYSTYFEPVEQGSRRRPLNDQFIVSGASPSAVIGQRREKILRALETRAFESLDDLLVEYGCERLGSRDRTSLSVVLEPACRFEAQSKIEGERATVSILVAQGLPTHHFQVAVRNIDASGGQLRHAINGSDFQWEDQGAYRLGQCSFDTPKSAICECRASFAGRVFDRIQIADPRSLPNSRRRIIELQDPELRKLSATFASCLEGDEKARKQFEPAVALLFHLLGFESVHVGALRRNSDGPDIYAWTPGGAVLVIECTTGQFDEKKFQNFALRVQKARDVLNTLPEAIPTSRVVSVIVTSNARNECGPQLLAAEKKGALLLCASDILAAVDRTIFTADADATLANWGNNATLRYLAAPDFN